jgi:hypothetical protein
LKPGGYALIKVFQGSRVAGAGGGEPLEIRRGEAVETARLALCSPERYLLAKDFLMV